jgi:hypothetical protein
MNMSLSKTYDTDPTVFYGAGAFFSLFISFKLPTHLYGSIVN